MLRQPRMRAASIGGGDAGQPPAPPQQQLLRRRPARLLAAAALLATATALLLLLAPSAMIAPRGARAVQAGGKVQIFRTTASPPALRPRGALPQVVRSSRFSSESTAVPSTNTPSLAVREASLGRTLCLFSTIGPTDANAPPLAILGDYMAQQGAWPRVKACAPDEARAAAAAGAPALVAGFWLNLTAAVNATLAGSPLTHGARFSRYALLALGDEVCWSAQRNAAWTRVRFLGCDGLGCPPKRPELVLKVYFDAEMDRTHGASARAAGITPEVWMPLGIGQTFYALGGRSGPWFARAAEHDLPPPARQRSLLFSFVGSLESNEAARRRMMAAAGRAAAEAEALFDMRSHLQAIEKWSSSYSATDGYATPDKYRALLRDSVFTLVPPGHSPECFRLWEAVLSGSIPILPRNASNIPELLCEQPLAPFERTHAPFIFIDDWDGMEDFVRGLGGSRQDALAVAEARQDALREWAAAFEQELFDNVQVHLRALMQPTTPTVKRRPLR